jgi:hypothetical protein
MTIRFINIYFVLLVTFNYAYVLIITVKKC